MLKQKTIISIVFFLGFSFFLNSQSLKPGIVLTFDDCFIDNWYELLPLFEKYNAKATFFISSPGSIDPKDYYKIKELVDAGCEIGCHGFKHVNAQHFLKTGSVNQYIVLLRKLMFF